MQRKYHARQRQDNISRRKDEAKSLEAAFMHENIHTHLIDLLTTNDSTFLNQMSIIIRKYLHASWLVDKATIKNLQNEFLIKPLHHLFKEPLEDIIGKDIGLSDVNFHIRKIFHKFFDADFVDEYLITLMKKSSKKILEYTNDEEAPRKTHILGVLNQIYIDSMDGYDLIDTSRYAINESINKRIPILNQMTRFQLTSDNFRAACTYGFQVANKDELAETSNHANILNCLGVLSCLLLLQSTNPTIQSVSFSLTLSLMVTAMIIQIYPVFALKSDFDIRDKEKNIHQALLDQLISTEILDELANEKIPKPRKLYKPNKIEKPVIAYQENQEREVDYSYLSIPNTKRAKILTKKLKIEKSINENSQIILSPIRPNISITWNIDGVPYTYHSNDAISNIIKLSSDDSYLNNYAQNSYVYFNEDIVWKNTGNKVKYQQLKNVFEEGKVVGSVNETGFTYRPDDSTDQWIYKLKVVHKKGLGHLNMFFKPAAVTKSIENGGKVIVSTLYMPR